MAGAHDNISIELDDSEVQEALDRLIRAGGNTQTAFADIGEHLLHSHYERWDRQEAPDGTPWEPLSPKYLARKKKNSDKILVLDGVLRDTLAYDARSNELEFGTNRIYGATHQFGDPDRNIPEREFLGFSADDETEILAIIQDYYEYAIRG